MRDLIRNVAGDAAAEGPTVFQPRLEVRASTAAAPGNA
jgi:LacI family transcriptional regulator